MKLLTLGSILQRPDPTPTTPAPTPVKAVPVDEYGRALVPQRSPLVGAVFQPRVRDRLSRIMPPWTPEQIVTAMLAAEHGDLQMQSELFEHMEDRDGALAGFMMTRRLAPCGLKWSIDPADDSPRAEKVAEVVRAEIGGIPNFALAFRDMQDAVGKSLSALWIDWQPGGRTPETTFHIEGLHYINPKRFRFHWREEKFLILPDVDMLSAGPGNVGAGASIGVQPEPWKVLVHRTRTRSGHPAKAGALRICTFYFLLRNYALKDWAVYCDIFGMPLRLGKYPDGASDADKVQLAEAMENLGTDAAAIVSKLVEIELVESKSRTGGGMPYAELREDCKREYQFAILGQDQTNTHNPTGGRTQVKEGGAPIRQDILEADCVDSSATLTAQLCYPIVMFSRFGQSAADELCPKFKLHYEPEQDYESMIAVDVPLHTVLGLPTTYGDLAKRYGRELPKGVTPDEIIKPPEQTLAEKQLQQKQRGQQPGQPGAKSFARRLTEALTFAAAGEAQQPIDDLADTAIEHGVDAIDLLAAPIRAIVNEATDWEDLDRRLRKAFEDLDAKDLERLIRRTSFVARLYGRQAAKKE